jgi:hypothetical protein
VFPLQTSLWALLTENHSFPEQAQTFMPHLRRSASIKPRSIRLSRTPTDCVFWPVRNGGPSMTIPIDLVKRFRNPLGSSNSPLALATALQMTPKETATHLALSALFVLRARGETISQETLWEDAAKLVGDAAPLDEVEDVEVTIGEMYVALYHAVVVSELI